MSERPWLILSGIFAVLALVTLVWLSIDRRPPEWDHANHLERALRCHDSLAEGGSRPLKAILEESSFYPPLVTCAAGALYFALPVIPLTAQAVMLGFLGIALAAIFALGRLFWDAQTGLLAAFFFATAPFVAFSLTNFQLDLPLAALVALALYALARTEGFAHRWWSVALGVVLGLGMLTKPPFPVYVLAPMLGVVWSARLSGERSRRLALLLVALAIGAALALPWYGPRLLGLPFQILDRSFKQAAEAGQAEALTSTSLLFHPRVFQPQFGLLAGPLCVWGLWTLRKERAVRAYLWLATLAPFLVFTLIQNKNLRYTLPILPATALVAAASVRALSPAWKSRLTVACIAIGVLQVSMAAFALPRPPMVPPFLTPLVISFPPSAADWQHGRILDDLARWSGGKPATVAVVPNYNFLSVSNLRYEALQRRLPLQMTRAWSGPPFGVQFAVLKTGSQGPSFSTRKPEQIMRAFGGGDPYLSAAFPAIGEYPLPDGSRAIVRARRIPPVQGVDPAAMARRLREINAAALSDYARDAVGLRVAVDYRAEAILRGEVDHVRVEADAATVGELTRRDRAPLRVRDVRVDVERLLIDPRRFLDTGALEILDAGALRLESLVLTQPDLDLFMRGQPAGTGFTVQLADGSAEVRLKRLALSARLTLLPGIGGAPLAPGVEDLRIGGIPVPGFFVEWVVRHFDPTSRLRTLPVPVSLGVVRIKPGRVEVGSPGP